MTDREKLTAIRAEVERRISSINNRENKIPADKVAVIQLEDLLSLIDSMQKEPIWNPLGSTHAEFRTAVESLGISQEEHVSGELEQAIDTYLKSYWGGEKEKQDWPFLKKMAIHFANWQKEQFEKNRLKHCNIITNEQAELEQGFIDQHLDKHQRMPTFLDAIEYGMRLKEQQMMAKAIDGEILENYDGKILEYDDSILDEKLSNCKVFDKVKIVVIKKN